MEDPIRPLSDAEIAAFKRQINSPLVSRFLATIDELKATVRDGRLGSRRNHDEHAKATKIRPSCYSCRNQCALQAEPSDGHPESCRDCDCRHFSIGLGGKSIGCECACHAEPDAPSPERAVEPHPMQLVDTCYGMTGGDLYVCERSGNRIVVRPSAAAPTCVCKRDPQKGEIAK